MAANYSSTSPWYTTTMTSDYMGILSIRPVSAEPDDFLYTIQVQYTYRPDLLAFDIYGDEKLWWVFIQRNMNILQDPIYDFQPGVIIYVPQKQNLTTALGL